MRKDLASIFLAAIFFGVPANLMAMPSINPDKLVKPNSKTIAKSSLKPTAAKIRPQAPRSTLRATIDLTRQRMTVVANGKRLYQWKISSGRSGFETPRGSFRPGWMAKRWHSRKYNMAPMPYSVFFNGGIATHGTTAVSRLGRPASHGCIRLQTSNARKFFNLVRRHGMKRTRIVVTGHARQGTRKVARKTKRKINRQVRRVTRRTARRTYTPRRRVVRRTAVSYHRTPAYRPARSRRLIYPGDRY